MFLNLERASEFCLCVTYHNVNNEPGGSVRVHSQENSIVMRHSGDLGSNPCHTLKSSHEHRRVSNLYPFPCFHFSLSLLAPQLSTRTFGTSSGPAAGLAFHPRLTSICPTTISQIVQYVYLQSHHLTLLPLCSRPRSTSRLEPHKP